MKLRIDPRSIKFKTFLYFILFAAFLMAALWIVQVFMLNSFYGNMKTVQTEGVVKDIENSYKYKSNDRFLRDVDEISDSYDMYIYVVSFDGQTTYFSPSLEDYGKAPGMDDDSHLYNQDTDGSVTDGSVTDGSVTDGSVTDDSITDDSYSDGTEDQEEKFEETFQYAEQIQTLNNHMIESRGSASMVFKGNDNKQEILAYGTVLSSKSKETLIAYVFSPLWPVSSTVNILKDQLIIVTIISLIIACLISFYLSTRITRPIRKINNSARKLADGEYGIVFKGGHYTELNDLADTLTGASLELEKADLMQKDLIANVSHDLRTPLTMIKSYAEMIRDLSGDNPEKREQHLQVIIDESDRLNNLVEDLLTVSRVQSGKMALDKTVFNLSETVDGIINTYKVKELSEEIVINFNCKSDFCVEADEDKIKQVVSNLLSNAIKFCGEDREINVSLTKRGPKIRFSVEDHGPGIAPEEIDHVWERYYRSSNNMIRSTEGTGLGLSICKEILVLHKSEFGVDSTLGKGSTFWFDLTLKR